MLGLAIGLILGGRIQIHTGVIEIYGPAIAWTLSKMPVSAAAMTLGHVVLARTPEHLNRTRDHERVHVRQYARWGPFFLVVYGSWSLWLLCVGKDPYRDNPFEIEAFRVGS